MIQYIVARGTDINALPSEVPESGTPLQLATGGWGMNPKIGLELFHLLIDLEANINSAPGNFGMTALQRAIKRPDLVEFLLQYETDVNAPAAKVAGRTALQNVAESGQIKTVKRFLELGADPNAPGAEINGFTVLEAAEMEGNLNLVVLLLEMVLLRPVL